MLKPSAQLLGLLVILFCNGLFFFARTVLSYQQPACARQEYRAAINMVAGITDPFSQIIGDFNGDDLPDVAVLGSTQSAVLPGNGKGQFDAARLFVLPLNLTQARSEDFNDDGILDLAGINCCPACCSDSPQAELMLGDGLGRFRTSTAWNIPQAVDSMTGDFNGDGKVDFVVAAAGSNHPTFSLSFGDGKGQLGNAITFNLDYSPKALAAGDFNGDGKLDLAIAHEAADSISIWLNDPREHLKFSRFINVTGPTDLLAQDFNRDGRTDLAMILRRQLCIYMNNGAGQFSEVLCANGTDGSRIIAADFNQDGLSDVAVSGVGFTPILLNNGNGTFTAAQANGGRVFGSSMKVVDVNFDGWLDLVYCGSVSGLGGRLSVYFGEGILQFISTTDIFAGPGENFNSAVGIGDFNRDGKLDLAFAGYKGFGGGIGFSGSQINILLADDAGNFRQNQNIPVGLVPTNLLVQDFNGDGNLDLAFPVSATNQISILNGDGTGKFIAGGTYTSARGPSTLATGDFNADGKPDLAVAAEQDNAVTVMLNNGRGVFSSVTHYPVEERPYGLTIADFNQDGKLDLAVSGSLLSQVAILLGDGSGRFSAGVSFTGGNRVGTLAAADFNKDGKVDLAVTEAPFSGTGSVSVFKGDGTGRFNASTKHQLDNTPNGGISVVDVNNDTWPDLVLTNQLQISGVTFLLNDKKGNLINAANYVTAANPAAIATGDLNNDGRPDFVVTTVTSNVSLILSKCQVVPELVTTSAASYRSAKMAVESIAALFGANLAEQTATALVLPLPTTLAGISVGLKDSAGNERLAPLFFVSPSQINYQIPAGLADGKASIVIKTGATTKASGTTQLAQVAPGLFAANSDGQGVASALALRVKADGRQSYELIARYDTILRKYVALPLDLGEASDQVVLVLFGTGIRNRSDATNMAVASIGGIATEVLFSGPQTGLVGLDQVNLRVPRILLGRGEVPIALTVNGKTANVVSIAIK